MPEDNRAALAELADSLFAQKEAPAEVPDASTRSATEPLADPDDPMRTLARNLFRSTN